MIEAVAIVLVGLSLLVIAFGMWVMLKLVEKAKDERRELEDRLMAVLEPVALTHVMAARTESEGSVTYVDEEEPTARKRIKSHEA
jgi:hypothetical protein